MLGRWSTHVTHILRTCSLHATTCYMHSFSRMRSEGFPFYTLGFWGLKCVRWTPFLSSQPFATVCNRLQVSSTVLNRPRATVVAENCRAYGKSCQRRDFCVIQVLRSLISHGRRGTLWHVAARLLRQKVAVPIGKVAQCLIAWKCQVWRSFVSRGRRGTLWHVDLWPARDRGARKLPCQWEKLQKMSFLSCVL